MSGAPQFPAERLISPPNSALARCGCFPGTTLGRSNRLSST